MRYLRHFGGLALRPYLKTPGRRSSSTRTGNLREHEVESEIIDSRHIVVYLPPGYSDRDPYAYPLILLQDGQNVFDAQTAAFGVEWCLDETAEKLITEQEIRPLIMVGVYNSPRRMVEYTPFRDPEYGGGGAVAYEAFLLHELLPFLERHYHVSKRPTDRAVIGSSLGGLLALHLGWRHPDRFGAVAALSPSLWWGRRGAITAIASGPTPEPRPQIWIDGGTLESEADENENGIPDVLDDLRTLRAVLLAHGYELGKDLTYREVEGQRHEEAAWAARVGDVLKAFFPKTVEH